MGFVNNFIKKKYWVTVLVVIAAVFGYKYVTDNHMIDAYLFPTVKEIILSFQENWKTMFINLWYSLQLMIPSIVISLVLALGFGIWFGLSKSAREISYPIVYTVSVIPAILLSPFVLNLAPDFRSASLFICVYCNVWPTLFATITGVTTVDKRYLDNAATLELTKFESVTKVILPAALPSIMSGFVSSLRGSFLVLVYAEMYGADYGMGYFVKRASNFGLFNDVWSGFIFMVAVLVLIMLMFEKIKDRMLKWTMDV